MLRLSPPILDMKMTSERPTLPTLASLRLPGCHSRRPSVSDPTTPVSDNKIPNVNNANDRLDPIPLTFLRSAPRSRMSSVSSDSSVSSEKVVRAFHAAYRSVAYVRPRANSSDSSSSAASDSSTTSSGKTAPTYRARRRTPVSVPSAIKEVQRHHPYYHPSRHRVVLTERFEDADMIVTRPIPPAVLALHPTRMRNYYLAKARGFRIDRPQLLLGRPVDILRREKARETFPADIYPYRILPRDPSDPLYEPAPQLTPPPTPPTKTTEP